MDPFRPPQAPALQNARGSGHSRQRSQSIAVQLAASRNQTLSHRPSASLEKMQYQQQLDMDNAGRMQAGHPYVGSSGPYYTNVPNSPSMGVGAHNAMLPPNYSAAGYGQRGFQQAGLPGMSRHPDDSTSVSSLIMERDNSYANSFDGHSEDDHGSFSSHMSHLQPPAAYAAISGGPRQLRQKTSFTHLKESEHKILSNEEKYNAYVTPGIAQYDGPEPDDALHDPGPRLKGVGNDRRLGDSKALHGPTSFTSWRGWLNAIGLIAIMVALITLFAGYPIGSFIKVQISGQAGKLHTNSTGQVPDIANFHGLIDRQTPTSAQTKVGQDGETYRLVFSDEFEQDGRTFYDGDDPFWTAMDQHYYSTSDVEYYDPQQAYTQGGYLILNLTRANPALNHNLSYMSAMLQTWNKFCFTGGILEASVSIPGSPSVTGLWPAFWTMGNLGRAGFGSTLDGTWPYSYDSCDSGTLPNQTDFSKHSNAWKTSSGDTLSYLPGQRFSACTCSGEDHPGPSNDVGRAAPELDVFEALVNPSDLTGEISQTLQIAPFDMDYTWSNTSGNFKLGSTWDTELNAYRGGEYQQSVSALAQTNQESYFLTDPDNFQSFSYEYQPSTGSSYDGQVTWLQGEKVTWQLQESGLVGNEAMDYSQRLIPREPMYIILNLGMAENFNKIDYKHLTFPAIMRIDWVRIYQKADQINLGCDPPDYPTADYINRHVDAYTNYNLTVWGDADPSGFPKNSLLDGC